MGEAKRRKALGLMPTVHPFEATLDTDGTVTFTRASEDADLREQLLSALRRTQPTGTGWATQYRREYIMAGLPQKLIETREDLEAIAVPPLRRLTGELVFNPDRRALDADTQNVRREYHALENGAYLRVRREEHSVDGLRWGTLPTADMQERLQYLIQHPLAAEEGEVQATYQAEHWQAGRIDIEPDPPAEQLEDLERLVRMWHGVTPEDWADSHAQALEVAGEEADESQVPLARRVRIELRELTPFSLPLSVLSDYGVALDNVAYTIDGETWLSYGEPGEALEDEQGELGELLSQMLDVETVPVTVWADGRVEWEEGTLPEEHAERIRDELLQATGAGNPEAWAAFTGGVLRDMFADEAPHLAEHDALPVPVGMKIDLPADSVSDPEDPAQYFIESEVTFDGQQWRDLYAEDVPEELAALVPPSEPN
ncbi:hypothetical protein [Deinococcus hopiensis]|uniref:Uncharacterized protein n=1 Tax=Deinococcus hopiensis KR-140 TaxID=695939 RepID=A0A1W1VJC0_9DEIO|nr:hypothetical protein [Deinococcus hopiensis]SMB93426.1 hypothetical protein SAMN00790413_01979 [Deinococcus hopiensis KR-140]